MSILRKIARLMRVMGGVQMVCSIAIALSFATLLSTSITWTRTGISLAPYYTQHGDHHYLIRLNDFPAEPLYTLFLDSVELGSFDDWPTCWLRPDADQDKHHGDGSLRKLLTVEDRFYIRGRGVVVEPGPLFTTFGEQQYSFTRNVVLIRPDERIGVSVARFAIPFISPYTAAMAFMERGRYLCLLKNVEKDDVPVGTEVWLLDA